MSITADLLRLFIDHGIAPPPRQVTDARRRCYDDDLAAVPALHPRERNARLKELERAFDRDLQRIIRDPVSYIDWVPTPDDWRLLAVRLAIKHEKGNFAFEARDLPTSGKKDWARSVAFDNARADVAEREAERLIAAEQAAYRVPNVPYLRVLARRYADAAEGKAMAKAAFRRMVERDNPDPAAPGKWDTLEVERDRIDRVKFRSPPAPPLFEHLAGLITTDRLPEDGEPNYEAFRRWATARLAHADPPLRQPHARVTSWIRLYAWARRIPANERQRYRDALRTGPMLPPAVQDGLQFIAHVKAIDRAAEAMGSRDFFAFRTWVRDIGADLALTGCRSWADAAEWVTSQDAVTVARYRALVDDFIAAGGG